MKTVVGFFFIMTFSITICSQNAETETIRLFYLGGQSNMDGYGYTSELPDSLDHIFENVFIFNGNSVKDNELNGGLGNWQMLKPGNGIGFSSNGVTNIYSDRFGVELSFASKLQQLYPNEKIAIIKYSRGGSSLDSLASYGGCWEPDFSGINQYDNFLTTLNNATKIKDIDGNGIDDILIPEGIIWMQGESDAAYDEDVANQYYANLKIMMKLIRAAFHNNDIPIVIGKISDSHKAKDGRVWDYLEIVQYAQEKFVKKDKNAAIVRDTEEYKYSDPWHYNSEGYIDLGTKFALSIYNLQLSKSKTNDN